LRLRSRSGSAGSTASSPDATSPTGVATQNPRLAHGLDPEFKSAQLANYVLTLRKDLLALSRACCVSHPALTSLDHVDVFDDRFGATDRANDVWVVRPDRCGQRTLPRAIGSA
jgi:hypothetical protein